MTYHHTTHFVHPVSIIDRDLFSLSVLIVEREVSFLPSQSDSKAEPRNLGKTDLDLIAEPTPFLRQHLHVASLSYKFA